MRTEMEIANVVSDIKNLHKIIKSDIGPTVRSPIIALTKIDPQMYDYLNTKNERWIDLFVTCSETVKARKIF